MWLSLSCSIITVHVFCVDKRYKCAQIFVVSIEFISSVVYNAARSHSFMVYGFIVFSIIYS